MGLILPLVLIYVTELWSTDLKHVAVRCETGSEPVLSEVGYRDCGAGVLLPMGSA